MSTATPILDFVKTSTLALPRHRDVLCVRILRWVTPEGVTRSFLRWHLGVKKSSVFDAGLERLRTEGRIAIKTQPGRQGKRTTTYYLLDMEKVMAEAVPAAPAIENVNVYPPSKDRHGYQ